jgi:hypothetical protein
MKIKISKSGLKQLVGCLKQFKIRHGPFRRTISNEYLIDIYPSAHVSLLLIAMSHTDLKILNSAGMM